MALLTSHIHGPSGNPSGAQGGIIQIKQTIYKTDQTFNWKVWMGGLLVREFEIIAFVGFLIYLILTLIGIYC